MTVVIEDEEITMRWIATRTVRIIGVASMVALVGVSLMSLALLSGCAGQAQPSQGITVPIQVEGNPADGEGVVALVSLTIHDHPFTFTIDTGQTVTAISAPVAQQLGLTPIGSMPIEGSFGPGTATEVVINKWSLGTIQLPSTIILSQNFFGPTNPYGAVGILGSDVWNELRAMTINFNARTLTVYPQGMPVAPQGGGAGFTAPIQVQVLGDQAGGENVSVFASLTIHGQGPFLVALDTGASATTLYAPVAQQLGLVTISRPFQIFGTTAAATATLVEISNWCVGKIQLPDDMKILSTTYPIDQASEGSDITGTLGLDVWDELGAVTINYAAQTLTAYSLGAA